MIGDDYRGVFFDVPAELVNGPHDGEGLPFRSRVIFLEGGE
jgi:hypothetical protein